MIHQEIYDHVKSFLLKQNGRAARFSKEADKDVCSYRGDDGTACAIGCLLPDALAIGMEGKLIGNILRARDDGYRFANDPDGVIRERAVKICELFDGVDPQFLRQLQSLHDCNEPVLWEREFTELAKRWKLTP